ncbi:MAG: 2Fe-2S iron-sulfur cluster-binding protein [Pseudobdellovibrionaceae bacterium]
MAAKSPKHMVFWPDARRVEIDETQTILETAIENRIDLEHSCGGMGSCGTCRIFVEKGLEKFDPRNEIEMDIAEDRKFLPEERLACQNHVFEGLEVKVPRQKKD